MTAKQELGPRQEKYLQMLESGDYQQVQMYLCKIEEGVRKYCCLGIACLLHGAKEEQCVDAGSNFISFDGEKDYLPTEVQKYLRFRGHDGGEFAWNGYFLDQSLIDLNDSRHLTFKEIAAVIREDPSRVFLEPA